MTSRPDSPLNLTDSGAFGRLVSGEARALAQRSRLQRRLSRLWWPATILVLALGPLAGYAAWDLADDAQREEVHAAFHDRVAQRAQGLLARVISFAEVLHACEGLYDASDYVNRKEFASFTRRARARHPEILCVAWAPRVLHADREDHVREVRLSGLETYEIVSVGAAGAPPHEHLPVLYIEPLAPYRDRLGLDLLADEALGPLLRRALSLQRPMLSDPLDPLEPGGEPLAMATLGVHKDGTLRGAMFLRFRYVDLLRAASDGGDADAMHLTLYDAEVGGAPRRVAATAPGDPDPHSEGLGVEQAIEFGGQRWFLSAVPTAAFLGRMRDRGPLLTGLVVFLLWELFAGCLLALSRAFHANALRRQGRTVGRVMRSLAEGVVVAGRDGRVRLANDAARELIGQQVDDMPLTAFEAGVSFERPGAQAPVAAQAAPLARGMRGEVLQPEDYLLRSPAHPEGVWVSASSRPLLDEYDDLLGGVLVLRNVTKRRQSESDLLAKTAELREREVEMELAADVQQRLYPGAAPSFPGLDVAGAVHPAVETCGDYYDYIPLPDGSLVLAVGDVTGHGLGPSLVMAQTRAYVRSLAAAGEPLHRILELTNRALCADLGDGMFVTLVLVHVAPDGRTVSYASAGHTPVLHVAGSGDLKQEMGRTGLPLGMMEDSRYEPRNGQVLEDGDLLVLMTDGATEASGPGEDVFEESGVLRVAQAFRQEPAAAIVDRITAALRSFAGPGLRRDDVTLMVCKRRGGSD